ncbi:hypothetical protein DFAR_3200013 [Desulfarculales bacterium]
MTVRYWALMSLTVNPPNGYVIDEMKLILGERGPAVKGEAGCPQLGINGSVDVAARARAADFRSGLLNN